MNTKRIAIMLKNLSPDINSIVMLFTEIGKQGKLVFLGRAHPQCNVEFLFRKCWKRGLNRSRRMCAPDPEQSI